MTGMIRKARKVRSSATGIVRKPRRKAEEHKLQVKLLGVIEQEKTHPDIYAFAVPNAGRRSLRTGAKMKAEGMRSGVGDLCIMVRKARPNGLNSRLARACNRPARRVSARGARGSAILTRSPTQWMKPSRHSAIWE